MRPQAPLSPRSGAMERKEGSEQAVWPSGRPLRPARIRPNPLNPGQTAPCASQIGLPERRGGRPNPFALPPPLPKNRPRPVPRPPDNSPGTRRNPFQPPRLQPRNLSLQHRCRPPLHQGDRNPLESLIRILWNRRSKSAEQVIGIGGMRTCPAAWCARKRAGEVRHRQVVELQRPGRDDVVSR